MKCRFVPLSALSLLLAACQSGGPIQSNFDPLDAAGGFGAQANVVSSGYRPGDFVKSVTPNTGFFKKRPSGEADADKLLSAGVAMKVISDDGSFVKVELDSGEVGYVSSVQVMGEDETSSGGLSGSEFQVWPPVEGTIPLEGAAEAEPEVPTVPTEIDPDAPVEVPPLPVDEGGGVEIPPLPDPISGGAGDGDAAGGEAETDPGNEVGIPPDDGALIAPGE